VAGSRWRATASAAIVGLFVVAKGTNASAAEPASPAPLTPVVELRHELSVDLAVTAAIGAAFLPVALVSREVHPGACRWCDGSPGELNGVDDWFRTALRRPDTTAANTTSHILTYGVAPLSAISLTLLSSYADHRGDGAITDVTLAAQGTLAAMLLTEVLKPIIVREQPSVHAIVDEEARRDALTASDAIRSFPSGHTTAVFGMAAASGMIATMRGYRLAPLVWAAGLMLGVATAYARIAADRHYFTDTLGGMTIGLVVGGGVPFLFHRPVGSERFAALRVLQRATLTTTPVPGGRVVGVGFAF
jgi:membrane-associated phospholipid phosphatase